MEERVYRFIQEHALLCLGDDVTVALSGGADSVALLWVMRRLAPRLELTVRAAHFHHGIRGEEADRDADFCRSLCRDWNIPFALGRGDAPARKFSVRLVRLGHQSFFSAIHQKLGWGGAYRSEN